MPLSDKSLENAETGDAPTLSVVVPVRNERDNLEPLIANITKILVETDHEIVYVDDGSSDGSRWELKRLAELYPSLHILHHDKPCGQSRAIVTGIRYARSPLIVTLDGDGQNDPADIPRLLAAFHDTEQPKLVMIIGHRARRKDTRWRRFSSRFARWVRATILNDVTPDTGCGIKIFCREQFLLLPTFNHMHRYLPILFRNQGGEVISLEVNHLDRHYGRSNYGTIDRLLAGIWDVCGVIWLTRRTNVPIIEIGSQKVASDNGPESESGAESELNTIL